MNIEQARKQVSEAVALRKQWGKQYTLTDVPTDFLDAVVMVMETPSADADVLTQQLVVQHEQLVLVNRQLGAAKSREMQLRKQLADTLEQKGG